MTGWSKFTPGLSVAEPLEWLAIGSTLVLMLIAAASYYRAILGSLKEHWRRKQLKAFDRLIAGDDSGTAMAKSLLRQERIVEDDVSIFLPGIDAEDPRGNDLASAIDDQLKLQGLGEVVRVFLYEQDSLCVDIFLNDFVGGIDVVRKTLRGFNLPPATTVEYSGGDLPLVD